jgi:predicted RNA polymerase sigma factor
VAVTATDIHRTIQAVFRIEQAKLIASLARITRDVGLAEELAQDALVSAFEEWPVPACPTGPAPGSRRRRNTAPSITSAATGSPSASTTRSAASSRAWKATCRTSRFALDDDIGDDLLRLIFTACHPVLSAEARAALTLRMLGGLTTDEIARAFLVAEPTIAQRIVRAKRTLSDARVPFEVPHGDERGMRLASVLEVIS